MEIFDSFLGFLSVFFGGVAIALGLSDRRVRFFAYMGPAIALSGFKDLTPYGELTDGTFWWWLPTILMIALTVWAVVELIRNRHLLRQPKVVAKTHLSPETIINLFKLSGNGASAGSCARSLKTE